MKLHRIPPFFLLLLVLCLAITPGWAANKDMVQ
jgi:hypothetical protein